MCNLDRIIDKCKEGDRQAAEKIYQIFSAKMFALCLRFSKDRADAEDTLQDGFIKIFTSIGQYTGKGSFEGWMDHDQYGNGEIQEKFPIANCRGVT